MDIEHAAGINLGVFESETKIKTDTNEINGFKKKRKSRKQRIIDLQNDVTAMRNEMKYTSLADKFDIWYNLFKLSPVKEEFMIKYLNKIWSIYIEYKNMFDENGKRCDGTVDLQMEELLRFCRDSFREYNIIDEIINMSRINGEFLEEEKGAENIYIDFSSMKRMDEEEDENGQ